MRNKRDWTLPEAQPVKEGGNMRRFYELPLQFERLIAFPVALTIRHMIDEKSPLYGMTAADLDMLPYQLALTQFELQKRPSGELIHSAPAKLIVAPQNRFIAYALTKSTDDPTSADRSVNPLLGAEDGIPEPFVWRYLTNPVSWFLSAEPDQTGLRWFDREKPRTKSWTDDETEVGVTAMRYWKSHGWNDYIGLVGNAGV